MMDVLMKLIDKAIDAAEEYAESIDMANYELDELVEVMNFLME